MSCLGKSGPLVSGLVVGLVMKFALTGMAAGDVLTTATYDTDSYVYFGTNNATATEITLGEPPAGDPHYNVGFIEFDVTGLSPAGSKYLQLEPNTATAVLPSTVRVSALDAEIDAYFAIAANDYAGRAAWLAAHAYTSSPIATYNLLPSGGKYYANVSSIINGWIADPSSNHGLALWRAGGADFDSPELFSMNDLLGRGPAINSVPEPQTAVLGAIACLALLGSIVYYRRHRRLCNRIA